MNKMTRAKIWQIQYGARMEKLQTVVETIGLIGLSAIVVAIGWFIWVALV